MFYVLTAFVVLAVPTACMGATLRCRRGIWSARPRRSDGALASLHHQHAGRGRRRHCGATYLILPALGLTGTVFRWCIRQCHRVRTSNCDFAYLQASRRPPPSWEDASPHIAGPKPVSPFSTLIMRGRQWILPLMLISGAASFIYEVLWTRMLSHILGGSIFAFATMVASFLLGIAAGSAVASRVARSLGISIGAFRRLPGRHRICVPSPSISASMRWFPSMQASRATRDRDGRAAACHLSFISADLSHSR